MRKRLRALLPPLPGFLLVCLIVIYSALRWAVLRLLIPAMILYVASTSIITGDKVAQALSAIGAVQWLRSERERKIVEGRGI